MLIVTILAHVLVLIALGGGAWLAMAGATALVVGVEGTHFERSDVERAAIAVIFAGFALFIAGTFGCLELLG
jgi:hypothetical protein